MKQNLVQHRNLFENSVHPPPFIVMYSTLYCTTIWISSKEISVALKNTTQVDAALFGNSREIQLCFVKQYILIQFRLLWFIPYFSTDIQNIKMMTKVLLS